MSTLDILTAEADRYDERLDRVLRQYRREHDATFAADLDIQYPRPAARATDELYRDVMAWIASLPRQASPWHILHAPRTRPTPADEPDVVVAVQITDEQAEQIRRRQERDATLTALVENNRPLGWTPRPEDFAPAVDDTMPGREATMPALTVAPEGTYLTPRSAVQAGPRGRFGRWVDERLERAETWWQARRAATAKRMGVED